MKGTFVQQFFTLNLAVASVFPHIQRISLFSIDFRKIFEKVEKLK